MILTPRTALVRNVLVSGTNGAITLVILLIAPLGLAAVIINTVLVTVATFATSQAADRVIRFCKEGKRFKVPRRLKCCQTLKRIGFSVVPRGQPWEPCISPSKVATSP